MRYLQANNHCRKKDESLTLFFLLLNWKIPKRPFFSALAKLIVLDEMESKDNYEEQDEGQERSYKCIEARK